MIELIIFILIFFVLQSIKKVPADTIIIIDRHSHYLKTKTHGHYILGPNDEITTIISTKKLRRTVKDIYETNDGKIIPLQVTCEYNASNIDNVLSALKNARRSIDDIIKSATYHAINALNFSTIQNDSQVLKNDITMNLISELGAISVSVKSVYIYVDTSILNTKKVCYTPTRDKCYGTDTKNYKHYTPIQTNSQDDGPIKYY